MLAALLAFSVPFAVDPARGAQVEAQALSSVELVGHGWGHGRGLGQYGALGYAVDQGWDSARILDHFYGGTVAGGIGNPGVTVELRARSGKATVVAQERGQLVTNADDGLPGGRRLHAAIRLERAGPSQFRVFDGPGCAGPWTARPTLVAAGTLEIASAAPVDDDHRNMLQLCEEGRSRWLRGVIRAVDAGGTQQTVNALAMESYLRGVVPRESPASWADLGGGRGIHALRAQAVAARSYAAAERRSAHASTCDTTSCQVYGGVAVQDGAGFARLEDTRTDRAVAETAGTARLRSGAVARTEFSSSTGGYSAGGTFPAVADAGDAISRNPNHTWRTTIAGSRIESAYGRSNLIALEVLSRNGLGEDGGRVRTVRVRFAGGSVDRTGDQFRQDLGLKSNWFKVVESSPPDAKREPAGGYLLRPNGSLAPFGAAPAATGNTAAPSSSARAVAIGGASGRGGYVLDGFGALRPFNGTAAARGAPAWSFDIGRDVALRRDGVSGYVLDGWGGVHAFGGAPPVTSSSYTAGVDTARRLALRPDGVSGWLLRADGSLHPFGGAPAVTSPALGTGRSAVGVLLHLGGAAGYVADDGGAMHPFGSPRPPAVAAGLAGAVAAEGRADGASGYLASSGGALATIGGAYPASGPGAATTRDLALVAEPAGYVLDGFGGLHPFGGSPRAIPSASWPGQDLARRVVVRRNGAGYVMDLYGGLHPFAAAGAPMPARPAGAPYWAGWAIARDVVLLPGSGGAGYVLDGFGGLHPFGGAPRARGGRYWQGWDIARRVALNPDGKGGYVLDGYGGLHRFAVGSAPLPAKATGGPYWAGSDVARDVVLTAPGAGYVLDALGGAWAFGGARGSGSWYSNGRVRAVGASTDGSARGWVVYADGWGGLHTAPAATPAATATASWPGWSIVRDLGTRPR